MTKIRTKIASSIAAFALMLNLAAPSVALAGVSCTISGNGADTENTCDFESLRKVEVDQDNEMDVDNDVEVSANTGDNEAEDNVGGDVNIETGNVDADVTVTTTGNTNAASVNGAGSSDYDLLIQNNAEDSDNDIELDVIDEVDIDQDNDADVDNEVDVWANTGKNEAEDNIGGSVSIVTGDVEVNDGVVINTAVNANSAVVGTGGVLGDLSIKILENGAYTDNDVDLALASEIDIEQDNDAWIDNDVEVGANTGDNEAEDNVGDEVSIETGDVDADVTVDTMANFNSADVEGGLFGDVELKIGQNVRDSDNDIEFDLIDELDVDQDNDLDVDNEDVDLWLDTGDNEAEDNVGGEGSDPSITTGDVTSDVHVSTSGNANVFGDDLDLELDFDLSELVDLLSALSSLLGL